MKTAIVIVICVFLIALSVVERNYDIEKKRLEEQLRAMELKLRISNIKAEMLRIEMDMIVAENFITRARGWYSLELDDKNKNAR